MDDFEVLLKMRQKETIVQKAITAPIRNNRADKNCSYEDFIEMIRKVLRNVMSDCDFVPHENVKDMMQPDIKIDNPIISFEVISRAPSKQQKPMLRHEVVEKAYDSQEERIGNLFAWQMDYTLQFNVFASGYEKAQSVMNTFEEAILNYTGFFKKNGVIECLFIKQLKDSSLESFREHASIRSLQYYAILERYWIDFESTLESVMIQNKNEKGDR